MNPEPDGPEAQKVPSWTPELGTRLRRAIESIGSISKAAAIAGVTPEQLSKWRDGKARPSFLGMLALARESGFSLDWLAGGADEPTLAAPALTAIDDELMGRVTDAIARLYKEERVSLAPIDLGRLAGRRYAEITAATENADERLAMIKLMVVQLRQDLRTSAAAPGSGKRSA